MKELIILIGAQGTGKSTYCREHLKDYTRISQDEQGPKQHLKYFLEALHTKDKIVVDRINHLKAQRNRYTEPAIEEGFKIKYILFNGNFADCMDRIVNRVGHPSLKQGDTEMAAKALTMFFNQYEAPIKSEYDEIEYV